MYGPRHTAHQGLERLFKSRGRLESPKALREATRSELAVMVETDHGMITREARSQGKQTGSRG